MAIDVLAGASDGAQAELLHRATERGYLLRSELREVTDPTVQHPGVVTDLVEEFREYGIPIVDDEADRGAPASLPAEAVSSDPVADYLDRATRHELLDAEEEADLAKRSHAGEAARQLLHAEGRVPPADRHRFEAIARDAERALERLIGANLRLVVPTARRYVGNDFPLIEALQEGNLGLIRAAQRFDPTKGYRFSTYAVWWIRQAIQRGLATRGRTIRLPVRLREHAARIRRAEAGLRVELGREPHDDEVAHAAELSLEEVIEVRMAFRPIASLDLPVGEDQALTFGSLLPDPDTPDPAISTEVADLRARLVDALRSLPERERVILELRYGLRDGEPRKLEEIGEMVQLSRERVRQLEHAALATLRSSEAYGLQVLDHALAA